MTKKEYEIIQHHEVVEFVKIINDKLSLGWAAQGGINTFTVKVSTLAGASVVLMWSQAITRG